ncbi:MAG: hypothetical protein AAFU49_08265 [Pseudomonadota bacterium]
MRRGWMLLLGLVVVAYYAVATVVSTLTLEDFATRPVTGFARDVQDPDIGARTERISVGTEEDFFGDQVEGTARPLGHVGTLLGYRVRFGLADGSEIACFHILRWMLCDQDWEAVRRR